MSRSPIQAATGRTRGCRGERSSRRTTLVPLAGFRAVADAVVSREATYGVLPIESSLAGPVAETHDLLYERALSIVGETVLPIRHCLGGFGDVPLDEIRIVRSHPMALDQCRALARPHAEGDRDRVFHDGRSRAAGGRGRRSDRGRDRRRRGGCAVRPARCSQHDVGDSIAFTRFVSIAPYTRIDRQLRDARTAFTFATNHKPGALFAAIEPFARAGLDLVRLVSRPLPATPWKYRFDAVVAGHPLEPAVQVALRELDAVTRTLRVVGVYEGHTEEGA